jgi:hypothetical protein
MNIKCNELKGTKILVQKRDVNAVQKVLLNCGFGYELALSKDCTPRKYNTSLAFFIDFNGFIKTEINDNSNEFWNIFDSSGFVDIDWSVLF